MPDYERIARELARALRGTRSQVQFSRRLGYRSNVAAKWESGSRVPTARTWLASCARVGVPVARGFRRFHEASAELAAPLTDRALAEWLRAQRGRRSLGELATAAGCSRHHVGRCLSGRTQPSLVAFIRLVDALTGRLPELASQWVDIERVPSLAARHRQQEAARDCAYRLPWSGAVLALVDAEPTPPSRRAFIERAARALELSPDEVERAVAALEEAGAVTSRGRRVHVTGGLLADTRRDREKALELRAHWARVAAARALEEREADLHSHSVFSVSRAGYDRIRALQLDFYAQARAIIAADAQSEVAGLMSLHLVQWR